MTVGLPAAVEESVTSFGEEAAALEFEINGPDTTPAVLREYRAVLAAYDRASAARSEPDALTALRDGRAALIRLDARRHGRPVPIDALMPVAPDRPRPAVAGTGERHVMTGEGDGRTEFLIDRPEPGHPALLEVDATDEGYFSVTAVTRTEDRTDTDQDPLCVDDAYHGRRYLDGDRTHLRVDSSYSSPGRRWSIRVLPLSAATVLAPEHPGHGDDVLRHTGGPALLTVQFQTDRGWEVRYVCPCGGDGPRCDCPPPAWPEDTPGEDYPIVYGIGDGRCTLRMPRPGFVIVHEGAGAGSWYLTTQPVETPAPGPEFRS
ncbi:hypothetical protein [Streptomyces sp. NPDC020298]|uniref:hypothetical protein n=1 Tax=unclassified Streptomyces TaxID=2593676 RepID=UPI0033E17B5F